MPDWQKYAPILHTGFADTYSKEQMDAFIGWIDERGFSGFSAEGKAASPTNDIEGWLKGFIGGLRYAIDAAKEKSLDVWLFDEWGYPTGTAAGKTMQAHPEWRSKRLHLAFDITLTQGQTVNLDAPGGFLSAAAWPIGRDTLGQPLGEDTPVTPVRGRIEYMATRGRERLCAVSWEYDNFRTVGIFIPDPEEDAQGTLDLMCGEAVAYFLTQMHERYLPQLGGDFGKTFKGFFYDEPFLSFPYPYTFDILPEFEETKGYDITPLLPRLLAGILHKEALDYRDVCTTRAARAFYGQMREWCHAHGVEMVGHQDLDHATRTLDSVSGHFFKNSEKNDAPGVDYIWAQLQPGFFADFPRFAGSARRLMGKDHAISESFAATSKCLFPDYMRFCLDYQIVRGIDRFFLMIADPVPEDGAFYTPLSKDHPQSAAFGRELNRRVALLNRLVNDAGPAAHIAVYIPMDALFMGLQGLKRPSAVSVSPYRPVWEYIDEAARKLCHMPVDFDYIWKEALLALPLENGALVTPGGQRIDTLILPAAPSLEAGIEPKLRAFAGQGGRLIWINSAPDDLIGMGEVCPDAGYLDRYVAPDVTIKSCGKPPMISSAHRRREDADYYFLLNEDEYEAEVELSFAREGRVSIYDFSAERWTDAPSPLNGLTFAPMRLMAFRVGEVRAEAPRVLTGEPVLIEGWSAVTPEGSEVDLPGGLTDWREFYRGDHSGWMTYRAAFRTETAGLYRLDLGRVCCAAKVTVDGAEYRAAFAPYVLDLELSCGSHQLTVEVLNTDANQYIGTPDAEKASLYGGSRNWLRTKMGVDRKYLASGLLGPVTVTPCV